MKSNLITASRALGVSAAVLAAAVALPAFAQDVTASADATVNTSVTAAPPTAHPLRAALEGRPVLSASSTMRADARASTTAARTAARQSAEANAVAKAKADAAKEIANRVGSLNNLAAKVQAMVKVSASDKATIQTTIQGQITALTALNAQIAADTSTTTLKTDVQSITKGYRIYALVEPQVEILAAADRGASISQMLTEVGTKISARLSSYTGSNLSSLQSLLADLNAKAADASTQGQAAISETASLQPDNGNASVAASNTAALKDARSKIQAAQADLKTAQQDALKLIQGLKASGVTASTTASATVNQ